MEQNLAESQRVLRSRGQAEHRLRQLKQQLVDFGQKDPSRFEYSRRY